MYKQPHCLKSKADALVLTSKAYKTIGNNAHAL